MYQFFIRKREHKVMMGAGVADTQSGPEFDSVVNEQACKGTIWHRRKELEVV